jgi:hypothetical protein
VPADELALGWDVDAEQPTTVVHDIATASQAVRNRTMRSSCAANACPALDNSDSLRFRCAVAPSVLDRVVRTEPLTSVGKSGSALERGWLDDGTTVVIKRADPRHDWIMQATHDDGRVAGLWADGIFDRLPVNVGHATIGVERASRGAVVVMRDVSAQLFGDEPPSSATRTMVLGAVAEMHEALAAEQTTNLCRLSDYLAFLSPSVCARFADHLVPQLAVEGWRRFHEIVDAEVGALIDSVHSDPNDLAAALLGRPSTIVHGDLKFANLGADGGRAIVLDWGTLTTWAPPAVDFAWHLAINAAATGRSHDDLRDEIRAAQGAAYDEVAETLALVGALAQLGWEKALGATSDDPAVAERERAGLAWWSGAVRDAQLH